MKVVLPSPLAQYTAGRREVEVAGATLDEALGDEILVVAALSGG